MSALASPPPGELRPDGEGGGDDGAGALNLVVVASATTPPDAARARLRAAAGPPARTVVLDPADGRGPDAVAARLAEQLDPALPTAVWLTGAAPTPLELPLARLADAIVLDTSVAPAGAGGVAAAFTRAGRLGAAADVLDLAWLRLAGWRARTERALLAAPEADREGPLARAEALELRFAGPDAAGPLLLTGWIAGRAGWRLTRMTGGGETWHGGARRPDGFRATVALGSGLVGAGAAAREERRGLHAVVVRGDGEEVRVEAGGSVVRAAGDGAPEVEALVRVSDARPGGGAALAEALHAAAARTGAPGYAAALTAIAQGLAAA